MVTLFNPLEHSAEQIEYECFAPTSDDDEVAHSVIVYTEQEADEYIARGWSVFPFPRMH